MTVKHKVKPLDRPSSPTPRGRAVLFLKGMAMGVADSVPGVSGGTIAVMAGIYEELLNSIKMLEPRALLVLAKSGPSAFWSHINGSFLLVLLLGIVTSLFLSANTVLYLLANHYVLLMSFFCGLVLASTWYLQGQVSRWNGACLFACLLGGGVTLLVALLNPVSGSDSLLYLFVCGFIAICAMILPGISGAFILLLLGVYDGVLSALRALDFVVIVVFVSGCVCGLLCFSHLLSWTFRNYREQTYSFLSGMLAVSLLVLWPWKLTGQELAGLSSYRLPGDYALASGQAANLLGAIALFCLGFALIHLFERISMSSSE
ncbi:MAG: DUF368 domain-containing protein [Pseudohongiellaceae bacterium]|nr:DUF368 domain-containing protein [Pseudohongiellaceae bacterium]